METPEDRVDEVPEQHRVHKPPDRPFHSKRRHKKSRKGCINCKTRKVKCDEAFPTCRSCYLRKADCVYPSSSSSASRATAEQDEAYPPSLEASATEFMPVQGDTTALQFSEFLNVYSSCSGSEPSQQLFSPPETSSFPRTATPLYPSPGLLSPSSTFDEVDLKLFWRYNVKTCASFTLDSRYQSPVEEALRTTIVSYAFEAPFLLNILFAFASVDLQNFEAGFDNSRAPFYHAKAIEGYRQAVERACPKSFPALIANSLLLAALSSQNFRDPDCKPLYIVDWMTVWRGITVIVELVGMDALFDSGLGLIFFRPSVDLEAAVLAIPSNLARMASSIQASSSDPDYLHLTAYITTLKFLGSLYLHLNLGFGPDLSLRIAVWPTHIPKAFVDLCELRRPRALVILAHYAAFIKIVQETWWLKGVSDKSISDIAAHLDPEWQPLLRVPLAVRQLTDKLDIARAILEDETWTSPTRLREDVDAEFAPLCEENPHNAAFYHLRRGHEEDIETDRRVDAEISRKIAQTMP